MRHGGDLGEAERGFGRPASGWLDLSTGINPRPWPIPPGLASDTRRLPSAADVGALLDAFRTAYRVPAWTAVCAAPGTELLIRLLPATLETPAVVAATTYRSYSEAFASFGKELRQVPWGALDRVAPDESLLVVSPNNPDGRRLAPEAVQALLARGDGSTLVLDEAYLPPGASGSVLEVAPEDSPVLVLKSFGKFFGHAGLRLGFAAGLPSLVRRLARFLGDWPASGPAISVGRAALADLSWQQGARDWLGAQAEAVDAAVTAAGLRPAGGTELFRVLRHERAGTIHAALARRGIWTRRFEERPDLLRIGLPADAEGLTRLGAALRDATS